MSCPPHFRRSTTSPLLPITRAPHAQTPRERDCEVEVAPGSARAFTRDFEGAEGADERGRGAQRGCREGRRSVTTGALCGSTSRMRGSNRAGRGAREWEDEELYGWISAGSQAAQDEDTWEGEVRALERLDEHALPPPEDYLLEEDLAPWLSHYPGPSPSIPPRLSLATSHVPRRAHEPAARPRSLAVLPAPPSPLSVSPSSASWPSFSFLDQCTEQDNTNDEADLSPLFSPEHATFLHIAQHGAGGPRQPSPSLSAPDSRAPAPRVSYDVPCEFDAWEAAARFVEEAAGRAERRAEDGHGGARADGARRRLERVRMQLGGA
ncbi:hypothetical protein JCM10450v2_003114 [Rhodotorula kratochvilovae]